MSEPSIANFLSESLSKDKIDRLVPTIGNWGGRRFKVDGCQGTVDFHTLVERTVPLITSLVQREDTKAAADILEKLKSLDKECTTILRSAGKILRILTYFRQLFGNSNPVAESNKLQDFAVTISRTERTQKERIEEAQKRKKQEDADLAVAEAKRAEVKATEEREAILRPQREIEGQYRELSRIAKERNRGDDDYDLRRAIQTKVIGPYIEWLQIRCKENPEAVANAIIDILTLMREDPKSIVGLIHAAAIDKRITKIIYSCLESSDFKVTYRAVLLDLFLDDARNIPDVLKKTYQGPSELYNQLIDDVCLYIENVNLYSNRYRDDKYVIMRAFSMLLTKYWDFKVTHQDSKSRIPVFYTSTNSDERIDKMREGIRTIFASLMKKFPEEKVALIFVMAFDSYGDKINNFYRDLIPEGTTKVRYRNPVEARTAYFPDTAAEKDFFRNVDRQYKEIIGLFFSAMPPEKAEPMRAAFKNAVNTWSSKNLFMAIYIFKNRLWENTEGESKLRLESGSQPFNLKNAISWINDEYMMPGYFLKNYVIDEALVAIILDLHGRQTLLQQGRLSLDDDQWLRSVYMSFDDDWREKFFPDCLCERDQKNELFLTTSMQIDVV